MSETKNHCFFDVKVDDILLGRITFELFSDICPKTCENFRSLCTGERGNGKVTKKPLHYKDVKFHRIIKDFMIQAGDFSSGSGTGGESIYGGQFEDENFELKHDTPFLLSMANKGKNTNGSQFFITTQTACHLDGKHVVFGRVMSGEEIVVAIENLAVDNRNRPLQPAVIFNCGEVKLALPTSSKHKEKKKKKDVSGSAEKKKKREKKKDKHRSSEKKHKANDITTEEGEIEEAENQTEDTVHPLATVSCINPDEIPEVPRNRFLDRGDQRYDVDNQRDSRRLKSQAVPTSSRFYTKSGRKVKGRGSLRFRTPSRSRSRSFTPPHWKQAQKRTITLDDFQRNAKRHEDREKEMEDRRRRREERHREQDEERQARVRDSDHEINVLHSEVASNNVKSRIGMSRISDNRRTKLKDMNDRNEKDEHKAKNKDDINMEMYDNLLDYEAPSENEEDNKENDEKDRMSEEKETIDRKKFTSERSSPNVRRRSGDRPARRRRSRSRHRSRSRDRKRYHRRSRSKDRRRRRSRTSSR